jgi:small subunit ribosomal protein S1
MNPDDVETGSTQTTTTSPDDFSASTERPSQRIRIGSQRSTWKPNELPTAENETDGSAAESTRPTPTETVPAEAAIERPKPVTPAAPAEQPPKKREPKHYPPPNIRDQLTPEMQREYEEALGDLSFESLMNEAAGGDAAPELAPESRVTGRVARIHGEDVFVDLGGRNQGVVPVRQFENDLPTEGAELELVVARFNADEGLYELSRPTAAVDVGNWDEVRDGQIIEVTITGSNKGGLECQVSGIRGFIPMGQVSIYRVENPEELVGQRMACVVTEASRERRNLVLSHRAVMERERNEQRDKVLAELAPGQLREGIVRSMKDFGAFVDLGGIDGLVHISQLSWDRVKHPSEVLEVGQKVKVRVEKFDKDTGKVSLSYREVGDNPWQNVESKFPVGSRVTGPVSRVMDFGAFVKLAPGVEGLIHISELAHGRVFRVSDVLSEGQEVEVKILSVDSEKQRISLSLKALMEPPVKAGKEKVADEDMPLPQDAPKPPKKRAANLKGGIGGPSGGEKFGLNW